MLARSMGTPFDEIPNNNGNQHLDAALTNIAQPQQAIKPVEITEEVVDNNEVATEVSVRVPTIAEDKSSEKKDTTHDGTFSSKVSC